MINEEILGYIKQNLAAGYARADIEKSLAESGWSAEDIATGFSAIEAAAQKAAQPQPAAAASEQSEAQPKKEEKPVSELQRATNVEVERLQKEMAVSDSKSQVEVRVATQETGIYGFLLRNNLANNRQSAQILLATSGLALLVLVYWVFLH